MLRPFSDYLTLQGCTQYSCIYDTACGSSPLLMCLTSVLAATTPWEPVDAVTSGLILPYWMLQQCWVS